MTNDGERRRTTAHRVAPCAQGVCRVLHPTVRCSRPVYGPRDFLRRANAAVLAHIKGKRVRAASRPLTRAARDG
jgi:hypothetical protein